MKLDVLAANEKCLFITEDKRHRGGEYCHAWSMRLSLDSL